MKNQKFTLEKILPGLKQNVPLAKYTTFKIGGPAKYFYVARTKNDIQQAIGAAKEYKLPLFILGEGSNVLVSDEGYKGLVIKVENQNYKIKNNQILAQAGTALRKLVKETARKGLSGLEWAGGLPGTLGGAIRGNAGAFGSQIKDNIIKVECLDKKNILRKLPKKKCYFSYRSSIFKKRNWIVLSAVLKLGKGNKKELQSIVANYIRYRKKRHPLGYANAGSIFKNHDLRKIPQKIRNNFEQAIKKDPFPIVPAAYFISEVGLKGKKIGQAKISEKHPNFIVNLGGARAKDVKKLINLTKKSVKKKFGVVLKEEIQHLGFRN